MARRSWRPDGRTRGVEKGAGDYVTAVDGASERAIAGFLTDATPDIPLVGEERGGATSDRYWLVDPLDGTTNFLHGFPIVAVSVALVEQGRPTVGVVEAPFLHETYAARRGPGRHRSTSGRDRRAAPREPSAPPIAPSWGRGSRSGTRTCSRATTEPLYAALERFEDLRRPGAAALDLAWVAAGVFDGFFELALGPWDVAAGAVLIREAGGTVTDWAGADDVLSGDILAGPPAVHAELLRIATQA